MEYIKKIRPILNNPKVNILQKINFIKQNVSAGEYKDALKAHPAFRNIFYSNPYFKDISDIKQREPFLFTGNFKKEFYWITLFIENFLPDINEFMVLKSQFENYILLESYADAKVILNKIEDQFGVNLWTIDANLFLEEYISGTESNWERLSYYLKEINNPFYEFIINFNSKRVEKKLSYENCFNQFQNDIDHINSSDIVKDFLVFKNFHIANYEYSSKNLESVLYISNIFSVIDQYLTLIDCIIYNISNSTEIDRIIFPFVVKAKEIVTHDNRLVNIYNFINRSNVLIEGVDDSLLYDAFDNYYIGNFEQSLKIALDGIRANCSDFEYYELYCKSLINISEDFIQSNLGSQIDEILELIFNILKFNNCYEVSGKKLLKLSLLFNSNFGKQLYSFLSEVEGFYSKDYSIAVLNSSFISPKNLYISNRKELIQKNLSEFIERYCFKIFDFKSGSIAHLEEFKSKSIIQQTIVSSICLYNCSEFEKVINLLSDDLITIKNPYYFERKIGLLYNSFLNINKINEAILLFGDVFFNESLETRKLNFFDLFEKIKLVNDSQFYTFIEVPVLFSLITKEYDVYEAFDNFILEHEIFNLREMNVDDFILKFGLNKTIYFLYNVVTIETIKYSTDFNSISEVEEERVYVLNQLKRIDPSNDFKYNLEINEIYKVNSVRKVLKEVDEGRLYIDVNGLKELQIKNFKDVFNRYKEIELLSSNKTLIGFNASNNRNWENEKDWKNEVKEAYSSSDYLAFKNIYLELRDNFLFNKVYGLDSCLSTRIRHGALKNHIRSVFEKLDLVTSKSNNQYIDNELWKNQLINHVDLNQTVQRKLKDFSREIDDYNKYIVERIVQIQTEKTVNKEEGLFKYFTNDDILYAFYTQNKSFFDSAETTIDILITNLVNYTVIDIQSDIVDFIAGTITNKYQSIIDKLITELRSLELPQECDLITNLNKSSTDIQQELDYLSHWFYLNTTSSSSLLSIETILNASIELTNRINPLFNLAPEIHLNLDEAKGYSNLIFVFNIMLNNVIEHSRLENDKIRLTINVEFSEANNCVIVKFTHNLNPLYTYSANERKLQAVKDNWNNHDNIDRSNKEGESGYDKIKRILLYEALAKTDLFDFKIQNNEIEISLFLLYERAENYE